MRYSPGEKRSSGELVDSQASPLPSSRAVGNVFALKRQELSTQHYCSRISHAASFLSLLTLGQTWGFYQGSALSSSDRAPKAPAPAPLCLTGNCRRLHNSVIHSQNDKLHVVTHTARTCPCNGISKTAFEKPHVCSTANRITILST